jgi:hypothetical protein
MDFRGQTIAETVECLERVRQLFAKGLIQSAFWHKFTATAHSPIGLAPEAHGIRITGPTFGGFAENDLAHDDPFGEAPDWLGAGLRNALSAYKEGEGVTADVRGWFDRPVPRPKVSRNWAGHALSDQSIGESPTAERRFVWAGGVPVVEPDGRRRCRVILPSRTQDVELRLVPDQATWLIDLIHAATPRREKHGNGYPPLGEVRSQYPSGGRRGFDTWIRSPAWRKVKKIGLLLI